MSSKGKGFNGKSKCRNKTISKEERRLIHTKKASEKQYNRKITAREHLNRLQKDRVEVNAKLRVFKKNDPFAPCLLQDVYVDGEYVDHVWVKIPIQERRKLKFCKIGCRIYFTAEVCEYYKRYDREVEIKFGLDHIELVKE